MSAMRQLVWLKAVSLRNQARRRAGRLKDPKYAIALLVGLAYFGFIFFPHIQRAVAGDPTPLPAAMSTLAPFLVAFLVLVWWIVGGYEAALAFTPAEVHLLFAAPIARGDLIRFKLMGTQLRLLLTVLLFGALLVPGPLPWYLRCAGLWVALTVLHWHQIAASLVRSGAARQGQAGLKRLGVPLAIATVAAAGLITSVVEVLPALRAAADLGEQFDLVVKALDAPVPHLILMPLRLIVAPVLAPTPAAWVRAMPGALLVLAAHYWWLMRTDTAFEEAAAEAGRRRAERLAAIRGGRGLSGLRGARLRRARSWRPGLAPGGRPAVAVLWKNILGFMGDLRPATLVILLVGIGVVVAVVSLSLGSLTRAADTVALMSLVFAGTLLLFGPLTLRHDLRRDLAKVEVLKTLPLRGRSLVAAEVAGTTLTVTGLQLGLLVLALGFAPFGSMARGDLAHAGVAALAAVVLVGPVNAFTVTIQNGFALLFPAWSHIGSDAPGGVEHMGQMMLTVFGTMVLLLLGMLVPGIAGAVAAVVLLGVMGMGAFIVGAAVVAGLVLLEVALLVGWLGAVFDALDPAEAGLVHA